MFRYKITELLENVFEGPYGYELANLIAELLNAILACPKELQLWFKFDRSRKIINAAGTATTLLTRGSPPLLP